MYTLNVQSINFKKSIKNELVDKRRKNPYSSISNVCIKRMVEFN